MNSYELLVQKNIEENKQVLRSLGLLNNDDTVSRLREIKPVKLRKPKTPRRESSANESYVVQPRKLTRRSASLLNSNGELPEEDEFQPPQKKAKIIREHVFGDIEGVSVGDSWMTRLECSADGVHRPTVAGIHGRVGEGCFSIALSGGYEDDIDNGESFTYTGCGGRDLTGTKTNPKNLRTAPQSKDQVLEGTLNEALASNIESRKPVRVIRGYKLKNAYAPLEGYRYDGLYSVEKCWSTQGLSGFKVFKYVLKRLPNQLPPPWQTQVLTVQQNVDTKKSPISVNSNLVTSACQNKADESTNKENVEKSSPTTRNKLTSHDRSVKNHLTLTNGAELQHVILTSDNDLDIPLPEAQTPIKHKQDCGSKEIEQDIKILTPSNSSDKRVTFSPKVLCMDEDGQDTFELIQHGGCNREDDIIRDDSVVANQDLHGKKQASILKYFEPVRKSVEIQPTKSTVNPKSLRSNRLSFSMISMSSETNSNYKKNRSPVANFEEKHSLENGRLKNQKHAKEQKSSPLPQRQCYVTLRRLEDTFLGWEEDGKEFHGFSDEEKKQAMKKCILFGLHTN